MERNNMFEAMHRDILTKKQYICRYNEARSIMKIISTIQEQNNG
jgi:hypothetical protein